METTARGDRHTGRVLAVLQGKSSDAEVIRCACEAARRRGSEVRALHVVEVPRTLPLGSWDDAMEAGARAMLDDACSGVAASGCRVQGRVLPSRHVGQAILDEAVESSADVIVVAQPCPSRSGDAALYVLDRASCGVWLWRASQEEQLQGRREMR